MKKTIIIFEDHGQDFLSWTLDEHGTVIGCEPFQYSIWGKRKVLNHDGLKVGGLVTISDDYTPTGKLVIKYPIEKLEIKNQ